MTDVFNGRFEVIEDLGAGTYFNAYRAFDVLLQRPVFVKKSVVSDRPVAAGIIDAHLQQWRTLGRLRVPGMPVIYDVFRQGEAWCLVTEWIDSPSLRVLSDPDLRPENPYSFLCHVLEGGLLVLGALHAEQIVHADISPGNVLADPHRDAPEVFLIDPAPALNMPDPASPAMRLILGNPAFAAPEVLAGHPASVRADLYSLGKVVDHAAALLGVDPPHLVHRLTAVLQEARPSSATAALEALQEDRGSRPKADVPPGKFELHMDDSAGMESHTLAAEQRDDVEGVGPPAESSPPSSERPMSFDLWHSATVTMPVPLPSAGAFSEAENGHVTVEIVVPPPPPPPTWADRPTRDSWLAASIAMAVPVPHPANEGASIPADFVVVAPNLIQAGRNFVLEIWVAPSGDHAAMLDQATRSGRLVERGGRSHINIARDALITVLLKLPDFEVSDPADTLGWNADIRNVGFIVKAPAALAPGIYPGIAKLMLGQVPFASIMFDLEVVSAERSIELAPRPREARVQRIARAFASYASDDRAEVLRRVQGIQAAGTNVFLDIINLRAGELWEPALYREVDASDGLFLFWSKAAKQSPWVEREWRYALDRRGIAFINPLALEDPRDVDPPAELRSKHFNDMLLAFIKVEDVRRAATRQQS